MSSFKEIQEKFRQSIRKVEIETSSVKKLIICLAPIKFELVDNEYHIFLMMYNETIYDATVILSDNRLLISEENIKNLIREKLNIILPINENNKIKLSINTVAYVFDGSKLNIEMINYLNKLNGQKDEYTWRDINLGTPHSTVAPKLKKILTNEIANGRIFE